MGIDDAAVIRQLEEMYPNIEWERLFEADRALNWELWHGPLPANYWTYVEPLDEYIWQGVEQACSDIQEMLSDLPGEIYYDGEWDGISLTDPEDDEEYWEVDEDENYHWIGSESWMVVDPRKCILLEETYRQVF